MWAEAEEGIERGLAPKLLGQLVTNPAKSTDTLFFKDIETVIVCGGMFIFTFLIHCFDCVLHIQLLNKMMCLHNWMIIKWPIKWNN